MKTQDLEFPARFRAARNRTGLSRLKVAKILGVNRETLGRWESGKRFPEISAFKKIYQHLGDDALPYTDDDLAGKMKLFRMKMGYRMKMASNLMSKSKVWWGQLENGSQSLSHEAQSELLEVLAVEEKLLIVDFHSPNTALESVGHTAWAE